MQIEFTAKVVGAETPSQLLAAAGRMLEKGFQMTAVQDETAVFALTMPAEEFFAGKTASPASKRERPRCPKCRRIGRLKCPIHAEDLDAQANQTVADRPLEIQGGRAGGRREVKPSLALPP